LRGRWVEEKYLCCPALVAGVMSKGIVVGIICTRGGAIRCGIACTIGMVTGCCMRKGSRNIGGAIIGIAMLGGIGMPDVMSMWDVEETDIDVAHPVGVGIMQLAAVEH